MGYFSNGTEGEAFREGFCYRCVNWRDLNDDRGPGCPIIDVHYGWNYAQFKDETARVILGTLIRRVDTLASDGLPINDNECAMFLRAEEPPGDQ